MVGQPWRLALFVLFRRRFVGSAAKNLFNIHSATVPYPETWQAVATDYYFLCQSSRKKTTDFTVNGAFSPQPF